MINWVKDLIARIQVRIWLKQNDRAYEAYRADEEPPGYDHEDHA